MPEKRTVTTTVKDDGTLLARMAGQDLLDWLADQFKLFAGGRVEISVSRPTRTLRQNRKYWAMLTEIAEAFRQAGVTELHMVAPSGEMISLPINKALLHRFYKAKYLSAEEPGKEPSTRNLDQTQMHDYMQKIRHDEDVRELDIAFQERNQIHA